MPQQSAPTRSVRYQIVLPISYHAPPEGTRSARAGSGRTCNLSMTGSCLELPEPLPAGTPITLSLESEVGRLPLDAIVRWGERASSPGAPILHGVAFTGLTPEERQALQALLQREGSIRSRIAIVDPVAVRARAALEVHLLDLSLGGACIEHFTLLRPDSACALELPPPLGPLILPARVVRSSVVGVSQAPGGDRLLKYESGLAFGQILPDQQAALARLLERLAPGDSVGNGRLIL